MRMCEFLQNQSITCDNFACALSRRAFVRAGAGLSIAGALALMGASSITLSSCSAQTSSKARDLEKAFDGGSDSVCKFTDSCGRMVCLPTNIQSVAPSGAYAQIFLSTLCPEKMVSLSGSYSQKQLGYLDERLAELPVTGKLYGTSGTLNYEQIIKLNPDVIIDVGEVKSTISSDLEEVQQKCGLPVIFVEATIDKFAQAYRTLGSLFSASASVQQKAEAMAQYIDDAFSFALAHKPEIEGKDVRVMYSTGDKGYEVKARGTVHSAVLDMVGVKNVAEISDTTSTEVSPERVMEWNPEVLLLSPSDGFFEEVYDDPVWAGIDAVKNKQVYEVPAQPYEWLDRPPSVQQVLGVKWLGNLLFPDIYQYDMVQEVQNFFSLFWGSDITEDEAKSMLANSTLL